jgi:hypothetical protein
MPGFFTYSNERLGSINVGSFSKPERLCAIKLVLSLLLLLLLLLGIISIIIIIIIIII